MNSEKDENKEILPFNAKNKKVYALFSYLGILVIVPLLLKRNDSFVKFHAKQGLGLFIAEIIWIVFAKLLFFIIPFLMVFINPLVYIGFIVLMVIGIGSALKETQRPLPVIADFIKKFEL